MLNITIFWGESNSLPVLTENCDVDGAGDIFSRGKKAEQGGGKFVKHLEERLREDPSKNLAKQVNQHSLLQLFVSVLC